jgi:hypothetical protein
LDSLAVTGTGIAWDSGPQESFQVTDDSLAQLVLQGEDVVHRSIVTAGPEIGAVRRIDQPDNQP